MKKARAPINKNGYVKMGKFSVKLLFSQFRSKLTTTLHFQYVLVFYLYYQDLFLIISKSNNTGGKLKKQILKF